MVGMALVALVMAMLALSLTRHSRASDRLAESRAATMLAERTLTALQIAAPLPAAPAGATVRVTRAQEVKDEAKLVWATVDVQLNGKKASLTGLVRADAKLDGGTK